MKKPKPKKSNPIAKYMNRFNKPKIIPDKTRTYTRKTKPKIDIDDATN